MHYYRHHIGDFLKDTGHLSNDQMGVYLRMLWRYYLDEKPLKDECESIAFAMRSDEKTVHLILRHFFVLQDGGWQHNRCDKEIADYHEKKGKAANSANARWSNASPMRTHTERNANAPVFDANQEPRTNNQEPVLKKQRGSRLPINFVMPEEWIVFCQQERQDLNPYKVFDSFKDFWTAKAGSGGVKLDWLATWRNWVRNQSVSKASFAQISSDIARTTVPRNQAYEDTQRRLREEADRNCTGPSLEVLAKMAAIRNGAKENHE
jgi:uncharacterized protein YdaU (DUF1376 family)